MYPQRRETLSPHPMLSGVVSGVALPSSGPAGAGKDEQINSSTVFNTLLLVVFPADARGNRPRP
jgi:hypothetical protein